MTKKTDGKQIPQRVVSRLAMYYRVLSQLEQGGIERVSSRELGEMMGITPSQIRQDLSYFGEFGQQGYGYRVSNLYKEISKILGLEKQHTMVLIGVGNLGRALASYTNFRRRGFELVAAFDVREEVVGKKVADIEIKLMTELRSFLKENPVDIGVITVPASQAQQVADILTQEGVKGIWNFAPIKLSVPENVIVEHVHISDSLFALSFRLREKNS
ncbi:MAG TPA: redox-sensing transcriptional repressor Rex [Firmicutes bacterium]|jgi:redox-sensing transcriptional repressor|nr:redox-sensing transcriptional repressor Rex [Bacillota bacterium]